MEKKKICGTFLIIGCMFLAMVGVYMVMTPNLEVSQQGAIAQGGYIHYIFEDAKKNNKIDFEIESLNGANLTIGMMKDEEFDTFNGNEWEVPQEVTWHCFSNISFKYTLPGSDDWHLVLWASIESAQYQLYILWERTHRVSGGAFTIILGGILFVLGVILIRKSMFKNQPTPPNSK